MTDPKASLQGWVAQLPGRATLVMNMLYVLSSVQAEEEKQVLKARVGRRRQSGPLGEGQGHPLGKLLCPSGCTVQRHRPASVRGTLQSGLSLVACSRAVRRRPGRVRHDHALIVCGQTVSQVIKRAGLGRVQFCHSCQSCLS